MRPASTSTRPAAESTVPEITAEPGVLRPGALRPGVPPGPRAPSLYQSLTFMSRRHQSWMRSSRARYGSLFTVRMIGIGDIVMCTRPELIKQVFSADPKVLHAGTGSPLAAVLGRHSLLSIDEEAHLAQRRLLLPPFHGERMRAWEETIENIAAEVVESWPEDREFAVVPSMQLITLRAILRTIFGATGPELARLEDLIPRAVNLGAAMVQLRFAQRDWGPYSPWGRFLRLRHQARLQLDNLIAAARRDPALSERTDVLAALVQATHEDGSAISDEEIYDQLNTLMIAGHETTATTLAWCVERLRRNPAALAKLTQEALDGDENSYREAVFREVLRARPTVTMSVRYVVKPYVLDGWELPVGTRIALHPGLVQYEPSHFSEPERFLPGRFLDAKPEPFTWIPFGGGIRRCIGASFAQMEVDVVLRTMLRKVELLPTTDRPEGWRFRGVTFVPSRGGRARVRHRINP